MRHLSIVLLTESGWRQVAEPGLLSNAAVEDTMYSMISRLACSPRGEAAVMDQFSFRVPPAAFHGAFPSSCPCGS